MLFVAFIENVDRKFLLLRVLKVLSCGIASSPTINIQWYRCSLTWIAIVFVAVAGTRAVEEHWALLGNKVYLITDQLMSWFATANYCTAKGMHMLTIESAEEQERIAKHFVSRKIKMEVWTAGYDLAANKTWVWATTGKTITYMNWRNGEPNNLGGNEHCIELKYYTNFDWNDITCSWKNLAACEVSFPQHKDVIVHRQTFTEE